MKEITGTTAFLSACRKAGIAMMAILSVSGTAANAQEKFPDHVMRLVVPYGPGTGTDSLARRLANVIPSSLKQPMIVENRAGGNGFIGAENVRNSAADGYSLILATDHVMCYNPALFKDLPYDPIKDFAPIAGLTSHPHILVVGPGVTARTVPELVALAKAEPGKITFGSTGVGTAAHLVGELFKHEAKIDITHIPYKGGTELFNDLLNGSVSMAFYPYQLLAPYLKAGRLFALANATDTRAAWAPDLPTMPELGYPQTVMAAWLAVYAPAGTPEDRISTLSDAFLTALKTPEITKALTELGIDVRPRTPSELGAFAKAELGRCKSVVELSGATVN